ncbi:PHD finger protein 12-like [Uloborus diversus]|uniref:PHD finger protein 12-like n=1 Tax=Uloborus diversus TaxID=327109 RepID=UPI0024091906|nr:PHD finger protein 12-like [Uloborus diversus]
MTSVEYDLDTSGGLMPQIQQAIAPPVLEDSSKKKKERQGRYRRPGRTINHDSCDNCKEGGDLICCDRCPAAFHLMCHDPPLSEDDLPSGEWLCYKCLHSLDSEEPHRAGTSGQEGGDLAGKPSSESPRQSLHGKPCSVVSALNMLIEVARLQNPVQFQLPHEISCTNLFPGSSKRPRPKENNRSSKKVAHEIDNGVIHLPAKLCFQCKRSCRKAPLIQCDYCPLLIHGDCLDPPLATLPQGRWMCPNHAEHTLDRKMLSSISLSERVKLWDQFSGPVSQDAVKTRFLNKVNCRHPPFRRKKKLMSRIGILVPNSVKEQYLYAPELLPRITAPLILEANAPTNIPSFSLSACPTEEQDEWLATVINFQTSVAKNVASSNSADADVKPILGDLPSERSKDDAHSTSDNDALGVKVKTEFSSSVPSVLSSPIAKFPLIGSRGNQVPTRVRRGGSHSKNPCSMSVSVLQPRSSSLSSAFSSNISAKKGFSVKSGSQEKLSSGSDQSVMKLFHSLQSSIDGTEDLNLQKIDEKLLHLLAYQRLQQLLPKKKTEERSGQLNSEGSCEVRGRAVVCPLEKRGPPVSMCYRSLHLGIGADMDVCFTNYGHCNFVSTKHASVFYDEVTKHYELLNYSSFGTTVDNILYSPDVGERVFEAESSSNTLSHSIRKAAKSSKRLAELPSPPEEDEKPAMIPRGKQGRPCGCITGSSKPSEEISNGWEGTAILHHGSYIKCGCLQFVFSITEYGFRFDSADYSTPPVS